MSETREMPPLDDNPRVGTCVFCHTSVWWEQERIDDERGLYHVRCFYTHRAEAAESKLQAMSEILKENAEDIEGWSLEFEAAAELFAKLRAIVEKS